MSTPIMYIIAGPNGAGKTTYAFRRLAAVTGSFLFVNLDEIARGLSPLRPLDGQQRAARVALQMTRALVKEGKSFSIETTLSGRTHLRTLAAARAAGFRISLFYFAAPDVETCLARIARRVVEGGHDVPEVDVRRRFARSLANLPDYAGASDIWRIFDVAGPAPKVAAEGRRDCVASADELMRLPPQLADWLQKLPACKE